jgi:glycosyltransferase involved in cell wall biosynthesis
MRLAFVQFGPFGEAERRFAAGGAETFYAQRYSVDFVKSLAPKVAELTVIHLSRDDAEDRLPSGVRSLGIELYPKGKRPRYLDVLMALRRARPDHVVVCTPAAFIITWELLDRARVLPLFADSFGERGAKARTKAAVLGQLLDSRRLDWVANHNLASSLDLVRLGVAPAKVLPWDWPALVSPLAAPPKVPPTSAERSILYVGQVTEPKGVGDVIEAVALLNARTEGPRWRLTIAGGTNEALARKAESLGVGAQVAFVGRIAHEKIVPLMNEHDLVVVPSWQEYPEGLPMTLYEAFCSRTPLVASDHRMFKLKLINEKNALIFPAKQPAALAEAVDRLSRDGALYQRLSERGAAAAADFFCPLKFDKLLSLWLEGSEQSRRELSEFSLASGRYDDTLSEHGVPVPVTREGPVRSLLRWAAG